MSAPRRQALADAEAARRRGDPAAAERLLAAHIGADPDHAEALGLLGTLRARRGDLKGAAEALERAVALAPRDPTCRFNLGNVYRHQGRLDDAVAAFRAALSRAPRAPECMAGLAAALAAGRDPSAMTEAEALCRNAVRLRPAFAEAHNTLGTILKDTGRADDALAAFRAALGHAPGHGPTLSNLANTLVVLGRHDEAVAVYREALAAEPANPDTRYNLANTLFELGRAEEAERAFQEVLALRPDHPRARHNLLFTACHIPGRAPEAILEAHRAQGERMQAQVGDRARTRYANDPDPARRLRVGYLSPDLKRHPVACFIAPVLAHHDPVQVEVTCYASVTRPDGLTAHLQTLVPRWRDVLRLSDEAVADRVAADGIDLLVDLGGYTRDTRVGVLPFRPAPVQVSYLGYPATTGLPCVDYRLTDARCDPPGAEAFYTERLVRLEGGFCTYAPPEDAPPVAPGPAAASGRVTFGSLINPRKLNDAVVDLWARVLTAVPEATLRIFRDTLRDEPVRRRLRDAFAAHGAGPDRVVLAWEMPREGRHLAVYHDIDVCLDTYPFCGHTTTCEALWMGVPTLTLAGSYFAGRMGASLMAAVGLEDFVAEGEEAFIAAARKIAGDVGRLAALRAGMRERTRSALCDGAAFTRHLEAAYRRMWTDWCGTRGAS